MPTNEAQLGEVWSTTDITTGRTMQGVVADVTPGRITFVSLTGNRVAVPPARLTTTWRFVQGTPRRTLPPCSRIGCDRAGMISFIRGGHPEYTCPRHAPFSAHCGITANYQVPSDPSTLSTHRAIPCPSCGNSEPAEDVRIDVLPARLWFCAPPGCGMRWVTIPNRTEGVNINTQAEGIYAALARWQLEVDSMVVFHGAAWNSLRQDPQTDPIFNAHIDAANTITLRSGIQAMFEPASVTEEVRANFAAILRVRNSIMRARQNPVQRLGGSPNRGGVVGSAQNPTQPLPRAAQAGDVDPNLATVPLRPTTAGDMAAAHSALTRLARSDIFEAADSTNTPIADVPIKIDSLWVQRVSGATMVVGEVFVSTDGIDVVKFKNLVAEENEPSSTMTKLDFLLQHRAFTTKGSEDAPAPKPMIEISPDEEWECSDGSGMIVTQIDFRKETVYGDDTKSRKHRQIPFIQFITGRWRKIVRRSVYERLRNPEVGLDEEKD